ncbi:MAG: hypothetical protein IJE78_04865 [Bacteroidaceae bacterium]|nr:hypothetical protein [Bacteroidaceae bacterium]
MAKNKWLDKLVPRKSKLLDRPISWIRGVITGSLYKVSDMRGNTSFADIKTQIDTMRALARDSQISTALSYYATDATTTNTAGDIIWATAVDDKYKDAAEVVNALFKRWEVSRYARDHILELATMGNLYIPTTYMYREDSGTYYRKGIVLDNNTIPEDDFDIVPSYKIPPETIVHLWYHGEPQGFIMDPDDSAIQQNTITLPEMAVVHFSLGGLLGDYTLDTVDADGNVLTYDIQFAEPLMAQAVQPTQTLSLLEDAVVLSSLSRTIKFINVECGTNEEEIKEALQEIKDTVEQQLALNTATGDTQSFVNPQSPNNLIYIPKIGGQEAISVTDLNMAEASDADNKLLDYYQNKKLSVLGVPKEAMNFSSNEGLGGAGSVLSQRSALYANALQRLENAYMHGWTEALNKYFIARNMSGFVNQFQLHMNPIITTQSTVQFEKRDSAVGQAQSMIDLLKSIGITDRDSYRKALTEILSEVFPQAGADVVNWKVDVEEPAEGNGGMGGGFGA